MVTPARTGDTTSITAAQKTTTAVVEKRGRAKGPVAEREAGGITIRAQWMTVEVGESLVRESIDTIIHIGSPEVAMGL